MHFLNRIGKTATAFSEGPFQRLEIDDLKDQFTSDLSKIDLSGYVVIILDAATIDRIGETGIQFSKLKTLVIDHHISKANFGGEALIMPEAPSTTYLILILIEQMGYQPDEYEAGLLLLGLCTDTGFFRHIDDNAPVIFRAVSRLTAAGASVKSIFKQMFGGTNLAERKLLGTILQKTEEYFNGKLLLTYLTLEEKKVIEPVTMKTEEVYRLLQLTRGVEMVLFIKQEQTDRYSLSFRSNGKMMVDAIAEKLGGGGHKMAAGCEISGNYADIKEKALQVLKPYFESA